MHEAAIIQYYADNYRTLSSILPNAQFNTNPVGILNKLLRMGFVNTYFLWGKNHDIAV